MSFAMIEKLLSDQKVKASLLTSGARGSVSFHMPDYVERTLVAAPSRFKSLVVELDGTDSTLTSLTPMRQVATSLVPIRWIWKVKFLDTRDISTLRLKISDPSSLPNQSIQYIYPFEVKLIKPWDYHISRFFAKYWQWVVATILSPIAVHFWRQWQATNVKRPHTPLRRKIAKTRNGSP